MGVKIWSRAIVGVRIEICVIVGHGVKLLLWG